MPRKGENIRQRKNGLWEGRYPVGVTEDGRTKYSSVYDRKYTVVKEKLLVAKTQQEQEEPFPQGLYEDVLREWLEVQALTAKASSYVKYRNLINGHIAPVLGELPLEQISTARLTRFMQDKAEHGRLDGRGGLSNSTLQALLLVLKSSLEYAARERYMPPMTFTLKCPEVKRESAKALTDREQDVLVRSLCSELDLSKLGILLCLYTGLRIGEVCALHWGDIDLSNGLLYVRQSVQRLQAKAPSPEIKTVLLCDLPKSECSMRSIPIPPCLKETLYPFRSKPDAYAVDCALVGFDDVINVHARPSFQTQLPAGTGNAAWGEDIFSAMGIIAHSYMLCNLHPSSNSVSTSSHESSSSAGAAHKRNDNMLKACERSR